jgi:hypothetical protein
MRGTEGLAGAPEDRVSKKPDYFLPLLKHAQYRK